VFPVKELVNYGLGLDNPPSVKNGAIHLSAKDYHEKLKEVSSSLHFRISPLNPFLSVCCEWSLLALQG
jgi:hypothetical protein